MIFTTLLNIAIFQGMVLGLIILKSPLFKSNANKYLSYAIVTISLLLLNLVFEIERMYSVIPFLRLIDNIEWVFILPVFIFLFIIHQVNHPIRHSKKIRWLFIPFLYSAVINIFYDLDSIMHLFKIPDSLKVLLEALKGLGFYIVLLFIPFMAIYTHNFIRFSRDGHEKRWITFLWLQVFVLLLSWLISVLTGLFFEYDISGSMKALALFSTILIHYTAYYGVFKYRLANDKEGILTLLYSNIPSCPDNLLTDISREKEMEGNNLESLTKDNPYFKKLEVLCKDHHIYRDSTLNREKVAEKLGISAGYVSQLINIITEDNFANYINNYRVEAVKKMIMDSRYENYSLLAIGLESGFTSKTTFHNAFKKATGMTPNTYRNTNK